MAKARVTGTESDTFVAQRLEGFTNDAASHGMSLFPAILPMRQERSCTHIFDLELLRAEVSLRIVKCAVVSRPLNIVTMPVRRPKHLHCSDLQCVSQSEECRI